MKPHRSMSPTCLYKQLLKPHMILAYAVFLLIAWLPIGAAVTLSDRHKKLSSTPTLITNPTQPTSKPTSKHKNTTSQQESTTSQREFTSSHQEKPLQLLATTTIAADLVKEIGKNRLHITTLMGPGIDPHLYKAREHDIRLIKQADIIVYHGLHLESKLSTVFERLYSSKHVIRLSEAIDSTALITETDTGLPDPHIWMDVALWSQVAAHLADRLSEIDPHYRSHYLSHKDQYMRKLASLDKAVHKAITSIPEPKRILITAHDAFSYYGRAYGLNLKALQGISTTSRFNRYDIHQLKNFIINHDVPAIFAEKSVSKRGLNALAHTLSTAGYPITLSDALYSDALSHPGLAADTYLNMIYHNTLAIVTALTRKHPSPAVKSHTSLPSSNRNQPSYVVAMTSRSAGK